MRFAFAISFVRFVKISFVDNGKIAMIEITKTFSKQFQQLNRLNAYYAISTIE